MPPIEVGPASAASAVNARFARTPGETTPSAANAATLTSAAAKSSAAMAASGAPAVETSAALDPGAAPVDTDRVAVIRKAVESGHYPVVPAQIADAMIAAGVLLRTPK